MKHVFTWIRLRGNQPCHRKECGNTILRLHQCVEDIEMGCGPRDMYKVYYCCQACYDVGENGELDIVCK